MIRVAIVGSEGKYWTPNQRTKVVKEITKILRSYGEWINSGYGEEWIQEQIFAPNIEEKLLRSSMMIRGVSPETESVRPECAILSTEEQSDIGRVNSDTTMQENRYDVDGIRAVGSRIESVDDANFDVDLSTLNGTVDTCPLFRVSLY